LQITLSGTVTFQGIDRARQQALDHEAVKARDQQRNARITYNQFAFLYRDICHVCSLLDSIFHCACYST
jgi:hypothetical protein